jgi:hypothetical protein
MRRSWKLERSTPLSRNLSNAGDKELLKIEAFAGFT